ncbi:helix-turn-helix domain-containing protein [Sciscionella sediminilitoris]|uniref:helix-turn-helix domain-containing protein n=1 Tax=Sciscionella sediminilitoris TaxID=1445613 RepID=UPI0004DFC516|nr:helix-turn-helix domain-containing protein [Sciscionella sp. SE31]
MAAWSTLETVLHPVRLRILQLVAGRTITTSELNKALPDIAPATIYRHVAALLDTGVLTVVAQRQLRGGTERTLALGDEAAQGDQEDIGALSTEQHQRLFAVFLAHLATEFDGFIESEQDDRMDLFGYHQSMLYLSPEDLPHLQTRLMELLSPYLAPRSGTEHRVSLATLLIPETDHSKPEE